MRKIFTVLAMLFPFFLNAQTDVKALIREGKLSEAWNYLYSKVQNADVSFETLEMLGNVTFEISEGKKSKNEIMGFLDKAMPVLEKNAFQQSFTKVEQARIFHKYNTLFAKKAQIQGATAALKVLPQVFDNADRCIALDPDFAEPYFVKASVDDEVPAFLGDVAKRGENAKYRMGINIELALERDPENIYFLAQAAAALVKRNWSVEEREKNVGNATQKNRILLLSDKEEAKKLLERAVSAYNSKANPTPIEKAKYEQALKLQAKLR
jgi:hypothetical protein